MQWQAVLVQIKNTLIEVVIRKKLLFVMRFSRPVSGPGRTARNPRCIIPCQKISANGSLLLNSFQDSRSQQLLVYNMELNFYICRFMLHKRDLVR